MEKVKKVVDKGKKALSRVDKKKLADTLKKIEDIQLLNRLEQVEKTAKIPSKISRIMYTVLFILTISVPALFNQVETTTVDKPTIVVNGDTLTVQQAVQQLEILYNTLKPVE